MPTVIMELIVSEAIFSAVKESKVPIIETALGNLPFRVDLTSSEANDKNRMSFLDLLFLAEKQNSNE